MVKHSKKQTGGTLLGLILGLILGLGVAVVVAVTIKNTPLPFTNKLGKPEKTIEPVVGQMGDPNKPLFGNSNAAKPPVAGPSTVPAQPAGAPEQSNEDQPDTDSQEGNTPDRPIARADNKLPATDKPAAEKPATDKPVADKSQKTDNKDEKVTYYLQAGAFLERSDAENTKAKLALLGFPANISERQSNNGTLYRVQVGPFNQAETMNLMRTKLSDNGVDVAVVRIPK